MTFQGIKCSDGNFQEKCFITWIDQVLYHLWPHLSTRLKYSSEINFQWLWKNTTLLAWFNSLSYMYLLIESRNFKRSQYNWVAEVQKTKPGGTKVTDLKKAIQPPRTKTTFSTADITDHHVLNTTYGISSHSPVGQLLLLNPVLGLGGLERVNKWL